LRAVDQPVFVADVTRLREHTGWVPAYPVEVTLRDLAKTAAESAGSTDQQSASTSRFAPFERGARG
jgi:GDP-4-dehydro-6-deoxy-D-mannose reductase